MYSSTDVWCDSQLCGMSALNSAQTLPQAAVVIEVHYPNQFDQNENHN